MPRENGQKMINPEGQGCGEWAGALAAHLEVLNRKPPPGKTTIGIYDQQLGTSIIVGRSGHGSMEGAQMVRSADEIDDEIEMYRERARESGEDIRYITISHIYVSVGKSVMTGAAGAMPAALLGIIMTAAGHNPALAALAAITTGMCWAIFKTKQWTKQMETTQVEIIRRYQSFKTQTQPPTSPSTQMVPNEDHPTMIVRVKPAEGRLPEMRHHLEADLDPLAENEGETKSPALHEDQG